MPKVTDGDRVHQDRAIGWVEDARRSFLGLLWGAHLALEPHLRICPIAPDAFHDRERFAAALALKGLGYQPWLALQMMDEVIRYGHQSVNRSTLREIVRLAYSHECIEREFDENDERMRSE